MGGGEKARLFAKGHQLYQREETRRPCAMVVQSAVLLGPCGWSIERHEKHPQCGQFRTWFAAPPTKKVYHASEKSHLSAKPECSEMCRRRTPTSTRSCALSYK